MISFFHSKVFHPLPLSLSTKMSNICLDDLQSKQIEKMTRRSSVTFQLTNQPILRIFAFKINILEIESSNFFVCS